MLDLRRREFITLLGGAAAAFNLDMLGYQLPGPAIQIIAHGLLLCL